MNYRHAYHAGNFADVLKHAVLAWVIQSLKQKEAAFRVVDTHAGIGRYDLAAAEAAKTGEWTGGIGRIYGPDAEPLPQGAAAVLAPYLSVVRAENPSGRLQWYPGSPRIARLSMRPQDHLLLNELHEADAVALRRLFGRDRQSTVMSTDGWTALKAVLPPKERRAIVLVDPPFEQKGDLERLLAASEDALARFATGVYLLWYPIKDPRPVEKVLKAFSASVRRRTIVAELMIERLGDTAGLSGCGLVVINPPYCLDEALAQLLPFLAERLARGPGAASRLVELVGEGA